MGLDGDTLKRILRGKFGEKEDALLAFISCFILGSFYRSSWLALRCVVCRSVCLLYYEPATTFRAHLDVLSFRLFFLRHPSVVHDQDHQIEGLLEVWMDGWMDRRFIGHWIWIGCHTYTPSLNQRFASTSSRKKERKGGGKRIIDFTSSILFGVFCFPHF